MNLSNPDDSTEENREETNQSDHSKAVSGPPAASKRDVQEAEKKADAARDQAHEAQKMAAEECEAVRKENQKLRQQLAAVVEAVQVVDEHLTEIDEREGHMYKSYTTECIPEKVGMPTAEEVAGKGAVTGEEAE
jgi:chromosome segregation ATPase